MRLPRNLTCFNSILVTLIQGDKEIEKDKDGDIELGGPDDLA
jgi:hypothetical protein